MRDSWLVFLNFLALNLCSVIELTDETFDSSIKDKNSLIMFFSPTCGYCKRFLPTFEKLGEKKEILNSGVLIAKVDCDDTGKSTCVKQKIDMYPTLKFINSYEGHQITTDHEGPREVEHLEKFIFNNIKEPISEIKDVEIDKFVVSNSLPVIIAFIKNENSKILATLKKLAPIFKKSFIFGFSFSKQKAHELGLKMETVNFYRQIHYKSNLEDYTLTTTSETDLENFLDSNKFSRVEYRNKKNTDNFLDPHITIFVKFDPYLKRGAAKRLRNIVLKTAKKYPDIKFSISIDEFQDFLTEIAPNANFGDLIIFGTDINGTKFIGPIVGNYEEPKEFAVNFEEFVHDFTVGNVLTPYIKSQPVDTPDDGDVKVVTALNFKEKVIESTKDVVIEFYAPWCEHCKKLAPIYQQLASLLKDEDHLILAKYDGTTNDIQRGAYLIEGYPTIFFAKSGEKNKPIQYEGTRDAKSLMEFIKEHSTQPITFDGEIPEVKEEL